MCLSSERARVIEPTRTLSNPAPKGNISSVRNDTRFISLRRRARPLARRETATARHSPFQPRPDCHTLGTYAWNLRA